jgi:F-type H+-transporting ATPase subunit c
MDNVTIIALASIIISGLTVTIGSIAPAVAEGRALVEGLKAIAQQPDESNTITRTLFVGIALIESIAIYCLVIALILIFFNPFWNQMAQGGGGG